MNTDWNNWFQEHRERLAERGSYLDGGEPGRQPVADCFAAQVRLLFCRLSPYADVRPSITHRLLYWAARQVPGVYADLAFLPPRSDAGFLRQQGVPWWLASGVKRAPTDFDIVAISLSVPQEVFNLPAALRNSGIALSHAERMADLAQPLVVLGGHAAAGATCLHGDANGAGSGGLVDVVCLGDGVEWLQELLRRWQTARAQGVSKTNFLSALAADLPGTYVPSQPTQPVVYRLESPAVWTQGYDGGFIPFAADDSEETLPLALGCAFRCNFCQTGWQRGARTDTEVRDFMSAALRVKAHLAASDLNLLASDACGVGALTELLPELLQTFRHVSLKSLTVASLAREPELRALMRRIEKREFSFGIEGVSARLRAWLGKPIDLAALESVVRELAANGLRSIKLFFIATGREEPADWAEFSTLLKRLRALAPDIQCMSSFTPLFHASFTPLQFAAIHQPTSGWERTIEREVTRAGSLFRWSADAREIHLMNLLFRAGRCVTPVLTAVGLRAGAGYYDGLSSFCIKETLSAMQASEVDVEALAAERTTADVLPWDEVNSGTARDVVWRAWERARAALNAPATPAVASIFRPGRLEPQRRSVTQDVQSRRYWVWMLPEDAFRPRVTVARGIWRDLFKTARPEGAAAYHGVPQLDGMPGTSGIALLSAEFRAAPDPVLASAASGTRGIISGPVSADLEAADCLFATVFPSAAGATVLAEILAVLKTEKVRFQTVRRDGILWSVILPAFRKRSGWLAVGGFADGRTVALAWPPGGAVLPLARWAGSVTQAVYVSAGEKCPRCGHARWQPVMLASDLIMPDCLDCLIQSK